VGSHAIVLSGTNQLFLSGHFAALIAPECPSTSRFEAERYIRFLWRGKLTLPQTDTAWDKKS
jgi:hypothetical protein